MIGEAGADEGQWGGGGRAGGSSKEGGRAVGPQGSKPAGEIMTSLGLDLNRRRRSLSKPCCTG